MVKRKEIGNDKEKRRKNKKEQIMKKMIGIIVLTIMMLFISISILGANVTVEEFKNKLSTIKRNKIETMECEIEIELEGNIIGNTKMYMKGNKTRMEIKGNVELKMSDIVFIQDSTGSYTKQGDKWIKGGSNMLSQIKGMDSRKQIDGLFEKKDLEVESIKNDNAIITFKETENISGIGNGRMGINLKTGNILFYELNTSQGNSKIIFEYGKQKGVFFIKKITNNTETPNGNSQMIINYKNVKINQKINDKIFKVSENK